MAKYISLTTDIMAKQILGTKENIDFTLNLIKNIININIEDLKKPIITNSVKLTRKRIIEKNFELDIILETKQRIYNIEIQQNNYICNVNSRRKIIKKYFNIFNIDLECEDGYTLLNKEMKGWIILFKARNIEEARKAEKYNPLLKEVIERMIIFMGKKEVADYVKIREKLFNSNVKLEGEKVGKRLAKRMAKPMAEDMAKRMAEDIVKKEVEKASETAKIEGREEGIMEEKERTLHKLLDKDYSLEEIEEITGIEYTKILSLTKSKKSELRETRGTYNDVNECEQNL